MMINIKTPDSRGIPVTDMKPGTFFKFTSKDENEGSLGYRFHGGITMVETGGAVTSSERKLPENEFKASSYFWTGIPYPAGTEIKFTVGK